jgi:diaminopimelate epimerase
VRSFTWSRWTVTDKLPFIKMQAVGNDFVVIEEPLWSQSTDWTAQALRLCDRNFGIGGDGLLVVGASQIADVRMRMFNPDGSEDMCGNGLRCVALLAYERGLLGQGTAGTVETLDGVRQVSVDPSSHPVSVIAEMRIPRFAPRDLPAIVPSNIEHMLDYPLAIDGYSNRTISTVNTGSTHTILWVEELPDDALFFDVSPRIETHPVFPERTSVLWTKVIDKGSLQAPAQLVVRIWERGVGETLGCGTGACAAATLALTQNKVSGTSVSVHSKGGTLQVLSHGEDSAPQMIGPAEVVYTGRIQVTA